MNPQKFLVDPMKEGHPEPFTEPQTIPAGWNVSDWLPLTSTATPFERSLDGRSAFLNNETDALS